MTKDREEFAVQTERLLAEYYKEASEYDGITPVIGRQYASQMATLLVQWMAGWRNVPGRGKHAAQKHNAGKCWCGIIHSIPGAAKLNGNPGPERKYDAMIQRATGQEDPLVQEPKE